MNQVSFEHKYLKLKVAKSPIWVRLPLIVVTALSFALPLFGLILNLIEGSDIKFGSFLFFGLFFLIGIFLLRFSLWNQFGQEVVHFDEDEIIYIADYGWFKDGEKTLKNELVQYAIKSFDDENEKKGVLVISNGESEIESVVKLPIQTLEKLIKTIETEVGKAGV